MSFKITFCFLFPYITTGGLVDGGILFCDVQCVTYTEYFVCRGLGDDEPSSVSYPTRTVLITGLDAAVTPAELRTAFDQYGDIVVSFTDDMWKGCFWKQTF